MLGIFAEVESNGPVTAAEFSSLQTIANNAARLNLSPAVSCLLNDVVFANSANVFANDGISASGNLAAGSPRPRAWKCW